MAELAHQDLSVVRNLSSSFPEAALLCDAFNGLTFSSGVRRSKNSRPKTFQLPMTRMSSCLHSALAPGP
jgi:hypothetical protein